MNFLAFIQSKHNLIFKLSIVLICSVIITFLLPNQQVKGNRVGSFDAIWSHPDLIAEKDFFLKKAPDEIDREKKIIEKESPLFFENKEEEKTKKENSLEILKQKNAKAYNILKPIFNGIYEKGVIESIDTALYKKQIFIANGSFAEAAIYFDFYTVRSAADLIENEIKKIM